MKRLGARVKALREERDWSLEDVASKAGLTKETVRRIEAGHGCQLSTANKIAKAYRMSLAELLNTSTDEKAAV